MKLSYKSLKNYDVHETNGHLGKLRDLYFDDRNEAVLFMVIDTGKWFSHHDVLVKPSMVKSISDLDKTIYLTISKEELEASPDASTQPPACVGYEKLYWQQQSMPLYWNVDWNMACYPSADWSGFDSAAVACEDVKKIHLRSANELLHYKVQLSNGEQNNILDFLIDDDTWRVKSILLDCGPWFAGMSKEFHLNYISKILWSKQLIYLNVDD